MTHNNDTYSARAAGFHKQGTSFFTVSERVMLVLSNSTDTMLWTIHQRQGF